MKKRIDFAERLIYNELKKKISRTAKCESDRTKNKPNGEIYKKHQNQLHGRHSGEKMAITDAQSFGKALRERRKALGYTQAYLSEFTGFSVSFISDLERGKETAELGKAIYLANMLGLDIIAAARGKA